jgi:hypothetical protein
MRLIRSFAAGDTPENSLGGNLTLPHNKDMKQKNDSGKVGRVRITGGSMSIQQLLMEFEWLVPGDHQWDITPVGNDAFRVVFPTKADLVRMRRLKPVDVQGTSITMHFEDWTSKRLDKWGIYDIWIRVLGLPDTLCRDYLGLFGVGSLVGKTKEVDMKFTREHGIACMRIDCTNPQLIPRYLDHFYDGEGFGIEFHVEALDGSVVPAGFADQDDEDAGDDTKNEGHDSKADESFSKDKGENTEKTEDDVVDEQHKDKTNSEDMVEAVEYVQFGSVVDHNCGSLNYPVLSPTRHGTRSVPSKKWYEIVEEDEAELTQSAPLLKVNSKDAMQMFRESFQQTSPSAAAANSHVSLPRQPGILEPLPRQTAMAEILAVPGSPFSRVSTSPVNSVVSPFGSQAQQQVQAANHVEECISPHTPRPLLNAAVLPHTSQASVEALNNSRSAAMMNVVTDSEPTRGTGVFLGGRYSREEVIAFGGIPESAVLGVRTSERIKAQPNADATQLERAQSHAQARDDILYSGNKIPSQFTIAAIPNDVVVARASKLGISLGMSPSNVSESIHKIKDIDLQRTLALLKKKDHAVNNESDFAATSILDEATRLSSDLLVEEQEGAEAHKEFTQRPSKPVMCIRGE